VWLKTLGVLMAKFDAVSILDWGIIGGRSKQQLEPNDACLGECARSTHV
jgi:hypothetical protein